MTSAPSILPLPGVHRNIAESVYRNWPAVNQSTLKSGETMAHVRHGIDSPRKTTPAMMMGSALDFALTDPAGFLDRYALGPDGNRGTKKWDEAQEAEPSKVLLKPSEWADVLGMAESLRRHKAASKLFAAPGDLQVSLLWRDEPTGLMCKARLDKLLSTLPFVVDLKSTADASPDAFSRTALNMGYHKQAAWYLDGCAACGLTVEKFIIPAVEQSAPYAVAVYDLGAASIELGRIKNREALTAYAHAEKTGQWAGFSNIVQPLEVPAWALRGIEVDSTFEVIA